MSKHQNRLLQSAAEFCGNPPFISIVGKLPETYDKAIFN